MRHDTARTDGDLRAALDLAANWYVALPSRDLKRRPTPLTLFGRELVAWRAGDGRPVLMPRFCPHMGASLAHGRIVDGLLECPFHGWRFDGSGACVQIPGSDRIPAAAHRQPYPTVERYGYVWAWYGSPAPMFALPELPALDGSRCRRFADTTTIPVRRILEGTYDPARLAELPGLRVAGPPRLRMLTPADRTDDHGPPIPADAWLGAELRWPGHAGAPGAATRRTGAGAGEFTLRVDGWPAGQRLTCLADGVPQYRILLATTPVGPHRTVRHIALAVAKTGRLRTDLLHRVTATVPSHQERPVPDTVRPGDRQGGHTEGDEGVHLFRRYYRSWVDRVADGA
jgi:nitrite reductase/ring-hydroxylating ferredoxin subunit